MLALIFWIFAIWLGCAVVYSIAYTAARSEIFSGALWLAVGIACLAIFGAMLDRKAPPSKAPEIRRPVGHECNARPPQWLCRNGTVG